MKTNLYSKVHKQKTLFESWRSVRSSGIASKSEETRHDIEIFEKNVLTNLESIYRKLLNKKYKFSPARGVLIKRSGKIPRPIVVAQIGDRVVQRAILDVVQSDNKVKGIFEKKQSLGQEYSFGGIKGKGVEHAIREACTAIHKGAKYCLTTDIKDFFRNIPRQKALDELFKILSDNSLNELLESATSVELENIVFLKSQYPDLFPSYEIGVAQGCCLSPFLGNILLHDFDLRINSNDIKCLRYIDDIIILGTSNKNVWAAFKIAIGLLKKLGFDLYHPLYNPDKANHGSTSKSFKYLGCSISPDFIRPDNESKARLISKIENILKPSIAEISKEKRGKKLDYDKAFISTLYNVHQLVRAWGNQYSFCNSEQFFHNLDEIINDMIKEYIGAYTVISKKVDLQIRRRLFGIHLLVDSKKNPVLPLRY